MELNVAKLYQEAQSAIGGFLYTYRVLREANVDNREEKNLVKTVLSEANKAEAVFDKIEQAINGVRDDEALGLRQSIKDWRNCIQEFKKIYGLQDAEPNA